jgi:hypothetical protein
VAHAIRTLALQITAKTLAAFGFVSVSATLVIALILSESLLSDDPYIMGWAIAIFLVPAGTLLLAVERLWHLKAATCVYVAYLVLLCAYFLYVFLYGELHAPGIAAILLISVGIYAPTLYVLMRSELSRQWLRAGWVMAGVFLVGLGVTYLAAHLAFRGIISGAT